MRPHDCYYFTASTWKLGGLDLDAIMIMGSWTSWQVLEETYIHAELLLLPPVADANATILFEHSHPLIH